MAMTMAQILARTPMSRKEKATYVKIKEVKVTKSSYGTTIYKAKTISSHTLDGVKKRGLSATYITTVETNMKQTVVSCSCEDFAFRWEVALNRKKAARIEYSNGELPVDTNPSMVPGCCGHLVKFGQMLISRGKVT